MTDKPKPNPNGRPSSYTQEVGDEICERMCNGESLRAICDPDSMPNRATVFRWLGKDQKFRDQYAHAREEQADSIFDECLQIADDATNDYMTTQDADGATGYKLNGEHVQRSKLRIDTRKWMAGKMRPKKYGEKIQQEISGPDGEPLQINPSQKLTELLSGIAKRSGTTS